MSGRAAPLVLSVFSTFAVGGPQVRFAAIANRFGAAFRHAVVAMDGRMDGGGLLGPDVPVQYPGVAIRKGRTLANVRAFRGLLRQLRPDVLMTSNWGTIEWAMANLRPVVRQIHLEDGFGPEEREAQMPRRVWMRRVLLRRTTVVLPSQNLWRIASGIWRLPGRNLRYIPNGIDLRRFAVAPEAVRPPVVGTVAALRPEKNLSRLLRAFALLPAALDARLVIVGDGPERSALTALADELGIADRTAFAGLAADTSALYRGFDVFALTSDTEQMPLTVLEAMASGLPVVATDVGDVRRMLAEANAPHVLPRDAAPLAASLAVLLADRPLRRAIGAANRAKAERDYDQETMFRAYAALIGGSA